MARKKQGEYKVEFTPAELLEYVKTYTNPNSYGRNYPRNDSFCNYTWNEALDMLEKGWQEGVREIELRADALREQTEKAPELIRDVTGDYFDFGIVLSGEPECCYRMEEIEKPKNEIDIVVNGSASWMVTQEEIFNRGAVIAALIDKLKTKYFVNVVIVVRTHFSSKMPHKEYEFRVRFSTDNEYSHSLLAFMVACPAFLRRIYYGLVEKTANKDKCGTYGMPMDTPSGFYKDDVIYFGALKNSDYTEFKTIENARKYCEQLLVKYNVA